jgi:small GTP-binding protein
MPTIEEYVQKLPPETQDLLKFIWGSLSNDERNTLQSLLTGLPTQTNLFKMLIKLSTAQIRQTFGRKSQVAIVGPANVGKSTLYNQLVNRGEDRAVVGPLPGTTRINQAADAGIFTIVDTPGADAVGEVGAREQQEALDAAASADFLIIVFDAIQGIKKTELELYERLQGLNKPYIVVINKVDLVKRESQRVVEHAAANLGLNPEQVYPISAKTGDNLAQVLMAIAVAEPQIVSALAQALPQYRWQLAWRSIMSAASISAAIALSPLPVIDFAPLIMTQSMMVLGIARIYQYKITFERARELVATFGLGLLGRTLFQQLSKLGGVPGWILSAAIASSTTIVMGYAAAAWFERGEKLSAETVGRMTKAMTLYLVDTFKGMGKRKPSKKALQQQMEIVLDNAPMAKDPTVLEQQADDGAGNG